MKLDKVQKNVTGLQIILDTGSDISTASSIIFYIKKPNGVVINRPGSLLTTGIDGKIVINTISTDLDTPGIYAIQARIVTGVWDGFTELAYFEVEDNLA